MKNLRPSVAEAKCALILGGARSGKSAYAEGLARAAASAGGRPPIYLATAQAFDDEMAERIARHRSDRGAGWETIEAPLDAPDALRAAAAPDRVVLVDCLTLWLSNVMLAEWDVEAAADALLDAIASAPGPVFAVSNEVGLGVVPDNALARRFRDAQGRLNQRVAAVSDLVVFMAAGLPMALKSPDAP